ncbi:hypothetical protein ACGFRG_01625 [Streptomyces sp. NPDC048696]|uniref:hypothetical protein n=1 Tax=Streptomyces sp. NPDC048696 TaxID=3365585 RepID=UPI00371DF1C6
MVALVLALALVGTVGLALSGTAAAVGRGTSDLRIASKRAYYNNNLRYGQSETITLYVYNAGPDTAHTVRSEVGYAPSMDGAAAVAEVSRARIVNVQPSKAIAEGTVRWQGSAAQPHCTVQSRTETLSCALPDLGPEEAFELRVRFPMTHETSYADRTRQATVSAATSDPVPDNNTATYTITPNHGSDLSNTAYWNTPGALRQLDPPGVGLGPIAQTDLRIASKRRVYNTNLAYGQSETVTLYLFNAGPAVAQQVMVWVGYAPHSLDYSTAASRPALRGTTVPLGTPPGDAPADLPWSAEPTAPCTVAPNAPYLNCRLPDLGPQRAVELSLTFPMTHEWSYADRDTTARVTTSTQDIDGTNDSTSYTFTPNHGSDLSNTAYWYAPGDLDKLNGHETWERGRPCQNGWRSDTPAIVHEGNSPTPVTRTLANLRDTLSRTPVSVPTLDRQGSPALPAPLTSIATAPQSGAYRVEFSLDDHPDDTQAYFASPDTLLSLLPVSHPELGGQPAPSVMGSWFPVRMLWPGAAVRGLSRNGNPVTGHVTQLEYVQPGATGGRWLQPTVHSRSHSYVVGTAGSGGLFTHNGGRQQCGPANVPAMLAGLQRIANNLLATTPSPTTTTPRPRPHLRPRPYPAPTPPPRRACPPPLPADVPRRDEDGNWLIYLYEAATPGVVANARDAVAEGAPWRLTYSPGVDRRRDSLRGSPAQSQLFNLTAAEMQGPQGNRLGQIDRDEYPPNIAAEGGAPAHIMYIEATDNQDAGRLMGQQLQCYTGSGPQGGDAARPSDPPQRVVNGRVHMQPGDTFRYAIIDESYEVIEYLGDGYVDDTQIPPPPFGSRPTTR